MESHRSSRNCPSNLCDKWHVEKGLQKQSSGGVLWKSCSKNFCKIRRKLAGVESVSNELQPYSNSCEFCKIFQITFFIGHLLVTASVASARSSHRRCSVKKVLLKISKSFAGVNLCCLLFSIKLQAFGLEIYYKETATQVFSCKICDILRIPLLKNSCERLLL